MTRAAATLEWLRREIRPRLEAELGRGAWRDRAPGRLVVERDARQVLIGYRPVSAVPGSAMSLVLGYAIRPEHVAGPMLADVLRTVVLGRDLSLSDQLTAYHLAEPTAAQVALCVFVKTKVPQIEWHKAQRTGAQLTEYLAKAELIAREITAGHFYKRPGKWCAWCDYRPVCMGDGQTVRETLIQIR